MATDIPTHHGLVPAISTPVQKCDTWTSIAKMHVQAGNTNETVMEAYHEAASFAEESGNLKHQVLYYIIHTIVICILLRQY